MSEGEVFTARVQSIAAGGAGFARPEGKSVFIPLSAPGDLLRCRISKDRKTWAEAEIVEILEPSAVRVAPECSLYGICGGCDLQHLSYTAQLDAKAAILTDAFKRIGGFQPPEAQVRAGAPFGYRNRVQFHSGQNVTDSNFVECGFMGRKSSTLVPLTDCPAADAGIRAALKEGKISGGGRKRFTVYSHGATFLVEGGQERGRVSLLGKELAMDVTVFFQSNAAMLELLIADVVSAASTAADKNLPMADVYCGVGTFAAFLQDKFSGSGLDLNAIDLDLIEENKTALALARENTGGQANAYALTDTAFVKSLARKGRGGQNKRWGFMVMDPPREGLSAPFAKWLAANGPDKAAYVSCNPAALARDSRILLKGGYRLDALTLYDFYPQTSHIESLALFSRSSKNE